MILLLARRLSCPQHRAITFRARLEMDRQVKRRGSGCNTNSKYCRNVCFQNAQLPVVLGHALHSGIFNLMTRLPGVDLVSMHEELDVEAEMPWIQELKERVYMLCTFY